MNDNVKLPFYCYCPGCKEKLSFKILNGKYFVECSNVNCAAGASSKKDFLSAYNSLLAWFACKS